MTGKNKPNPNGANATTPDSRQQVCWDLYVKSINEGKENAQQAALDAGYEKTSAANITLTGWFLERKEKLKRKELVSKAEKVFIKTLDYNTEDKEGKIDSQLLRVQTDVAKFIASTQGKNDGYSNLPELKDNDVVMIVLNN